MVIGETIFLLLVVGISTIMYYQAGSYPDIAGNLPKYFLLLLMALSFVRLAVLFFAKKSKDIKSSLKIRINRNLLKTIAATFVLIVSLRIIGFYVSVFLVLVLLPKILGYRKVFSRITTAVLVSAFIYLVFDVLLKIEFKEGMLLF